MPRGSLVRVMTRCGCAPARLGPLCGPTTKRIWTSAAGTLVATRHDELAIPRRVEDIDAERVEETLRVNIISLFHVVRRALPRMGEASAIINVAWIQAYKPSTKVLDDASTTGVIATFTKGARSVAD